MYNDDQSNLPPATSGALPQAIARKNARRGGTPNAPEVDDEAAPASNNGSAAPQTIGTMAGTAARNFATGPGGQLIGGALNVASQLNPMSLVSGAVGQVGDFAKAAFTPQPGPTATPAAPGAIAAPSGQGGLAQSVYGDRVAPVVPPPVAPVPGAITRVGNEFSGVGTAPPPGQTMTTEQANDFYGAQNRAMEAKAAQDAQESALRSTETGNKSRAAFEAGQIQHGTELFHANNVLARGGTLGMRGAAIQAGNLSGRADELTKFANAPSAIPPRNLIAENAGQETSVQAAQQAALTNPLHVAQLKQGLEAGGTAQEIAKLTLQGHQSRQGIIDELAKTTDHDRHLQLTNALLAMEGKPPQSPYEIHGVPGALGEPATGFVIDKRTGTARVIAGKENPLVKTGFGQHPEGSRLLGKDGKTYIVKNGQPVAE